MELRSVAFDIGFGILVVVLGGLVLLPVLKRLQFRQHAYEDAPQSHQVKTGTPTMGGILFVAAIVPFWWLTGTIPFVQPLIILVALCALIGFIDDLLGITRGKNQGLTARTKLLATALVAIVYLRMLSDSAFPFYRDVILHTSSFNLTVPHWLWLALGIVAIAGTIHAVNLTDGLDGLATGTMIPPLVALALIGKINAPWIFALVGIGACLGFLVYNKHPAKMFMGDTGSLALGGLLSGIAILEGEMLLLVLIGGVFVAEALSVMLQVTYFKLTGGKRIFRMSPLHHHFEMGGWPETKVTWRFWTASAVLSLLGWVLVR